MLSLLPTLPLRLELVKVLVVNVLAPLGLGGPKEIFGGTGFLDLASSLRLRSVLALTGGWLAAAWAWMLDATAPALLLSTLRKLDVVETC